MDAILYEIFNIEPILEVSQYRSDTLKIVDDAFAKLKKNLLDKEAKKELILAVREFTGIERVSFSIKPNLYNAMILPIYKNTLPSFLDLLGFGNKQEIKKIGTVEEVADYIDVIYIDFGEEMIKNHPPRELTSILLHEIGHAFHHTANLPFMMPYIMEEASSVMMILKSTILLPILTTMGHLLTGAFLFTLTRTLTFLDHRGEYKADQFAAKYGYGDEMLKALHKFHKFDQTNIKQKSVWTKFLDFIENIVMGTTHPSSKERICAIANKMIEDYKNLYPKFNKELDVIFSDLKCKYGD